MSYPRTDKRYCRDYDMFKNDDNKKIRKKKAEKLNQKMAHLANTKW